jgi:alpha/beta hydrolase fold
MAFRPLAFAAAIVGAGVLAIALVSGFVYEEVGRARDREQFPPIGRSIDLGGRTLTIDCSGQGGPAVILAAGAPWAFYRDPKSMWESGTPRPGYSWIRIQRALAQQTTTCWFDRAGSGWSDLGPYPRDSASHARDLRAVLRASGIPPPYVLVAESSAALDARVYTSFFPEEIAGLVLVDAVHPDLFVRTGRGKRARFPAFLAHSQDSGFHILNRLGLYRGAANRPAPAPPEGIADSEWRTIWHLTQSSKARSALMQDIAAWDQSTTQARAAGTLGDRPLIVVSSESAAMDLAADLVRLSTRGRQVVVGESGRGLIYRAPAAIVDATRRVLAEVGPGTRNAPPRSK